MAPIITAFRQEDQIVAVLPFHHHEDFRTYFVEMTAFEIQQYMHNLLSGLSHIHSFGIIHRDIKPSNFLYSRQLRKGVIVDFGLAQV